MMANLLKQTPERRPTETSRSVRGIQGFPARISYISFVRAAYMRLELLFRHSEFHKIALSLAERYIVRSANIIRIVELHLVIFPEADLTNAVATWRLQRQGPIPTTWARIANR